MLSSRKIFAIFAMVAVAAMAQPFTYLNLASGDSELIGISGTETLRVGGPPITEPNTTNFIDFFPYADGSDNLLVGDGTSPTRYNQMYSFTYEVMNGVPVESIGIVLQGVLGGSGFISYTEDIFALDGLGGEFLIGTMGNGLSRSGTTDPVGSLTFNGATFTYTQTAFLDYGVTHYKVKKSFFLMVDPNDFVPSRDYAGISLIQQSHIVPEPATIAATLMGLAALAARKRRKS